MSIVLTNPMASSVSSVHIAVHGGVFHADDVLAVTLAHHLHETVIVDRVFSVNDETSYDYIIDVGRKYDGIKCFDHHQEIEPLDEGVLPCGASLYAKSVLNKQLYNSLYERVIRPVCVQDNGQSDLTEKYPNNTFGWVHYMNPTWDSDKNPDEAFKCAVVTALPILEAVIAKIGAESAAADLVESAPTLEKGAIVVLPQYAPWQNTVIPREEARFVIHPSNRGGFMLNAVPPSLDEMFKQRISISWVDAPEGCTFTHKAQFCASFDTQEHAIAAARMLLPCKDAWNAPDEGNRERCADDQCMYNHYGCCTYTGI